MNINILVHLRVVGGEVIISLVVQELHVVENIRAVVVQVEFGMQQVEHVCLLSVPVVG